MKKDTQKTNVMEKTLDKLSSRRDAPLPVFILLLILYLVASGVISATAGSGQSISIFGKSMPMTAFVGVFSALSEICVIFMTFYCGKKGYFTALTLLIVQFPFVIISIVLRDNMASLPGVFGNILAIIAITIIYVNNKRMKQYQDTLRDQAVTDRLTGLPNLFACTELAEALINRNDRFTVVSINVDGLKAINDTMGFDMGDKVLCEITSSWKTIADMGISGTIDFIGRANGDEFILIIRNYHSEEDIVNTIRMYEGVLHNHLTVDNCDFYVSANFGYAEFPEDTDSKSSVFAFANAAVYEIKHSDGSNRILHFTSDMLQAERSIEIEKKIRDALEKKTIFFNLQPQFNMDHKLRGFEVLARMKDTDGTVISPAEFIPVAEKVGLIDKLDGMVFRKAAEFFGEALQKTGADILLSVNISVRHLMKNDFLDEIRDILQSSGVPADKLEIEITESIMIDSMEKALHRIDEIKSMGLNIAIDDFGTGYSSLSYLNEFPADLLKIDKSFIDKMNESKSSKQYVSAIISIGHIMGFDVISEGVEELEQIETLREIGCDYIQGFIWGRPLPQEEAEKLIIGSVQN